MDYLLAGRQLYMNTVTFQLLKPDAVKEDCNVAVPSFWWNHPVDAIERKAYNHQVGNKFEKVMHTMRGTTTYNFNNCRVEIFKNLIFADITWRGANGDFHKLEINITIYDGVNMVFSWYMNDVKDDSYFRVIDYSKFSKVTGLMKPAKSYPYKNLSYDLYYGLSAEQLKIYYKGKALGTSYAFVLGHWAILLDDNFCFDSVAVLTGTDRYTLFVEKFLYSVNQFVVKAVFMLG